MATDVVGLAVVVVGLVVQTRYVVCAGWLCVLVLVGCEPFSTCTFQPKHNNVCNQQHRPVPPVVSSPSSAAMLPSRQLCVCFPINGCVTHVCRFWSMWLQNPPRMAQQKSNSTKNQQIFYHHHCTANFIIYFHQITQPSTQQPRHLHCACTQHTHRTTHSAIPYIAAPALIRAIACTP